MHYYEALGLEPKLGLDLDDLKQRFYDRSRQWHPDRFSRASPEDRQRALDMTATLNDAFRTLRATVSRAEYFLGESGVPASKEAPPDLLEEAFEFNMALEELRSGDESARAGLAEAEARFLRLLGEIDASLEQMFTRYDDLRDRAVLGEIRGALNRRRYISNLVRDAGKELADVHLAN